MLAYLQRLRDAWNALEAQRQLQIGAAVALTVLVMLVVGIWASQTPHQLLLSDRGHDELSEAAAALHEAGISSRLTGDGGLEVPVADLARSHAALRAADGVRGPEDAAAIPWGTTPAVQNWAMVRAKEGDLARTVTSMRGVLGAQVNIVPEQEALFVDDVKAASASVFLKLRPSVALGEGQVRAIVNLVANSVQGLPPDNVSVVDSHGNLLAEGKRSPGADGAAEAGGQLVALRARLQRSYEDAVSRSLLPVLGYDGGFSVTANVDLDPTSAETKTRRYDPEGQVVSSEELEETLTENNKPNGVPGVDANLPERPVTANSQTREEANQSRSNFMYPTVDELSRRPAGAIRHLSIAVQVDSARVAALATAHEIAPEEMQKRINDIVQAASGASDARGDVVEVAFLPFAATKWADGDAAAPALQPIEMLPYVPYAVAALAILLTFWFVVRPLMAAGLGTAAADEEEEDDADNVVELPGPEPLAARLREMVDNYEPIEATDLNNLIDEYPEATAQVLRKWSRA